MYNILPRLRIFFHKTNLRILTTFAVVRVLSINKFARLDQLAAHTIISFASLVVSSPADLQFLLLTTPTALQRFLPYRAQKWRGAESPNATIYYKLIKYFSTSHPLGSHIYIAIKMCHKILYFIFMQALN